MEYKALGDIATYINGYAFKPEDRGDEGLPIIRIQDLTGNSYDLAYYNGEYPKKNEINDGDILISWSASLGIYVWHRGKALLNQHIFKVEFDKAEIDKNFFVYAVRHKLNEMALKTHGATMKHIVKKDFDAIQIPYPPMDIQTVIATNLTKVSNIIEARKEELDYLDQLIKARFVEMFGEPILNSKNLEMRKFGDICDLKAGDFTSAESIHEVQDEKYLYPCYGGNGIRGYVDNYNQEGDYPIIGRQGALCGNVQYATGKFRNTEHAVLVTPKTEMNKIWLYELLVLEDLNRYHTGAAQPGLAVKTLNLVDLPFADINLQNDYATFYKQIDKSKFVILNFAEFQNN